MSASLAAGGGSTPSFDQLPLSAEVRKAVDGLGYQTPTPVQLAVYEPAKQGLDLVVQARTGTGKTAAFGLPLVDGLVRKKNQTPQAIVLTPTRELALQVSREITALAAHAEIAVACVYGGAGMSAQIEALQKGPQIIVGTPGRILDHIARGTLKVQTVRVFVLDESDEMLSMGFLPQIDRIWSDLPKNIQVLLFSATVPREVVRIADSRLKDPKFITLSGDQIGALEINHFVYLSNGNKYDELLLILEIDNPESAIVFCNTRDETKQVAGVLQRQGYSADWLNADLPQNEREAVMKRTREGALRFLVCTDVAARGIDISHLTHVINFDFPDSTEQYVHRTGRTGRAGRTGTALSLVEPGELGNLYFLRLQYKIRPVERQLPSAMELRTRAETDVLAQLGHDMRESPGADLLALARRLLTHDEAERMIGGLLQAHLAAREEPWLRAQQSRRSKAPAPAPVVPAAGERRRVASSRGNESKPSQADRQPSKADQPSTRGRVERPAVERPVIERAKPKVAPRSDVRTPQREPRREKPARQDEHEFRYEVSDIDPAPAGEARQQAPASRSPAPATPAAARSATTSNVKEIFVNVGREHEVTADELRGILQRQGIAETDIKRIAVRFRNSFIQVTSSSLSQALSALNGQVLRERSIVAEESRSRP